MAQKKFTFVSSDGTLSEHTGSTDDLTIATLTTGTSGVTIGSQAISQTAAIAVFGAGNADSYHSHDHGLLAGLLDDDHTQYILAAGTRAFSAAQSMGGFKLTNVADPTVAQDAATKAYVDARDAGLKPKEAARVGMLTNVVIATALENADVLDGITLATGNRVLLTGQTAPAENGIYVVQASGAAVRSTDFDSISPIDEINRAWVPVQEGTQAGKTFVQYGNVATVGTDAINFTYYDPLSAIVGGDMISKAGSTLSVDLASTSGLESSNAGNVAGQLRIKLEASNPSLLIDGSNQLGAKLNAAGAIISGASGLISNVDGASIEISANALQVKDAGITSAKLAAAVAGAGLVGGAGTALAVGAGDGISVAADSVTIAIDGATLSKSGSGLKVADLGITNAQVSASAAIAYSKLNLASSIVNADIAAAAAIAHSKLANATAAQVLLANSSGVITATTISGDATISDAGVLTVNGASVSYTASGAIAKGDLVYVSGNNAVTVLPISGANSDKKPVGFAFAAAADTATVKVIKFGVSAGTLTAATAGVRFFWSGSAFTATKPSGSGEYVHQVGVAKNATDLDLSYDFVVKNS